jgi:hypothetical protein
MLITNDNLKSDLIQGYRSERKELMALKMTYINNLDTLLKRIEQLDKLIDKLEAMK